MDKKNLRIISCVDCKQCQCTKVNNSSVLYSCRLNKHLFDIDRPDVSCNKPCYKDKSFKKKN